MNGMLVASSTSSLDPFDNNIFPDVSIGLLFPTSNLSHDGPISFVAVWNRQLSHAEVAYVSADPFALVRRSPSRPHHLWWAPEAVVYQTIGNIFLRAPDQWTTEGTFALEATMRQTTGTAIARLRDLTTGATVANSTISTMRKPSARSTRSGSTGATTSTASSRRRRWATMCAATAW